MITRTYRIEEKTWEEATKRAKEIGLPMSAVIRMLIRLWLKAETKFESQGDIEIFRLQ